MADRLKAKTGFQGFGKDAMGFLKALGFHQNREWFHENRKLYENDLRLPLIALVEDLTERFEESGIPLKGTGKTSLFRINRDIRFSKEKHPYNTHVSAVLTRTGTKKDTGGIYMQFGPTGSFIASGLWFPESPVLKAMREAIVERRKDFLTLASDLEAAGLPIGDEHMLTRAPVGFKDVEDEALLYWLRHKSFIVQKNISEKTLGSTKLLGEVEAFASRIMPLMQFAWRASDPLREEMEPEAEEKREK